MTARLKHRSIPGLVGTLHRQTATKLAEDALDRMKGRTRYAVGIDFRDRVYVSPVDDMPIEDIIMTCTRASDPDDLADAIRDEKSERHPTEENA